MPELQRIDPRAKPPTRSFPLRTILTVTTDRLLTEPEGPNDNGTGKLYEILGWMTNGSLFTHQLGRFSEECKLWLFRWFPELAYCSNLKAIDSLVRWLECDMTGDKQEGVRVWLAEQRMMFPQLRDHYDVPRIPADDHDQKDPYDELVARLGTDENIVLVEIPEA